MEGSKKNSEPNYDNIKVSDLILSKKDAQNIDKEDYPYYYIDKRVRCPKDADRFEPNYDTIFFNYGTKKQERLIFQDENYFEDEEEKYEIQVGDDGMIKVPVPTDIPDINLEDIKDLKEEDRALVLGTRSKLFEFIDLINTGQWKQLKTKKDTKMYVRMSERGNI